MPSGTHPYSNTHLDELLKPVVSGSAPPVISKITVVGGLFDKNYMLHDDDIATVKRALKVLDRAGIGIARDPRFDFYNLLAPLKSDFIHAAWAGEPRPEADMIVVCGIWGGRSPDMEIGRFPRHVQDSAYENFRERYKFSDLREVSISFGQCSPDGWPMAAHFAGAKIVVTRGPDGMDAVNSSHFLVGEFYKAAIATGENYEYVHGSISGPLGIVVHKDAAAELKARANPCDHLGQRILNLKF